MIQIRNLGASHSDMHLFILLCDLFNYESSLSFHNCYAQETVVSLLEIKKSKFVQDMWGMVSEVGSVLRNIQSWDKWKKPQGEAKEKVPRQVGRKLEA